MNNDEYYAFGELVNQNGKKIPIKVQNAVSVNDLLWVPGIKIFGADYAAGVMGAYGQHNANASGLGGKTTTANGLFNPILIPISLSWSLGGGNFIGSGLSVFLPIGQYAHSGTATTQESYANNFWTFEPNFAYSYLKNGWDFTINNVFDLNTENPTTHYHSGATYYADLTGTRTFGSWNFGVVGNYTKQFVSDEKFGQKVNNSEIEHILVGPLVSYDFGRVTLTARYLDGVFARNDINVSLFHLGASFKF